MKRHLWMLAAIALTVLFAGCGAPTKAELYEQYGIAGKTHAAVTPAPQTVEWAQAWWMPRHEKVLSEVADGEAGLIYVGDSITHGFETGGRAMWEKYYAPRHAVNMGFSGDQTQHVLWRLEHGEIDGINPRLAIVMIGTNNSNGNDFTAEQIADGIKTVCADIRATLPETKILLLAIFPRGRGPSAQREKNAEASRLASAIADGKHVFYLDINEQFLDADGTLPRDVMPDLLHPNEKGYVIWAEAIEPTVKKLMGE